MMIRWTIDVLICYIIVGLLRPRHDDLAFTVSFLLISLLA